MAEELRTGNVTLTCDNARFKGTDEASQILWQTYSGPYTFTGCTFKRGVGLSQTGIIAQTGFDPENPANITGNIFNGFRVGGNWAPNDVPTARSEDGNLVQLIANTTPSVFFTSNISTDNFATFVFGGLGGDENTMFGHYAQNLVIGDGSLAYEPLAYPNPNADGVATTTYIVPNIEGIDGNIYLDYGGVPLPDEIMADQGLLKISRSVSDSLVAVDVPENNLEFQINQNPEGEPFVAYMANVWPGAGNTFGETASEAGFNWAFRPMPGFFSDPNTASPAISRQAGPRTPVFDKTGDWRTTKADALGPDGFIQAYNDSITETLSSNQKSLYDIDGDGFVNNYDFSNSVTGGFMESCEDCLDDCNNSGTPDLIDIVNGTTPDVDGDGVPDSCCTTGTYSTFSPNQNFEGVEAMRYLSFSTGTNPGQQTALRVHTGFNELDEPTYHYVQEPNPLSQASGSSDDSGTTFLHSNLGCEPFYTDWSQYAEPIYVSGRDVTPNRAFDVQAVSQICGTVLEANFSAPYTIGTSQWGDLTDACGAMGCGAPNGSSDFDDISAIVDKFRNLPISPHKASADVAPEIPDLKIDFTDIPDVVDGFRGLPYSYSTGDGC